MPLLWGEKGKKPHLEILCYDREKRRRSASGKTTKKHKISV